MDAATADILEKMTHEPEMYAHHCQGLIFMMEHVLRIASISQECVKLSSRETESAARKMTKRIIAWFWDTRFKNNPYRLIPRAIFATEDVKATHTVIVDALYHVQGWN